MLYNTVFKKTSTFIAVGVVGAFYFERLTDVITDTIFDNYNRGVRTDSVLFHLLMIQFHDVQKQWKDIKKTLEKW